MGLHEATDLTLPQRPFAESLGDEAWADRAGHITSVLAGQYRRFLREYPDTEGRVKGVDPIRDTIWRMSEVCLLACEEGFSTRDQSVVGVSTEFYSEVAASAFSIDDHEEFQARIQTGKRAMWNTPLARRDAAAALSSHYLGRAAEVSYLWGRHGEVFGLHGNRLMPTIKPVVKTGSLTTVNVDRLEQVLSHETVIQVLKQGTELQPYVPSLGQKALALFSKDRQRDLAIHARRPELEARREIREVLRTAIGLDAKPGSSA